MAKTAKGCLVTLPPVGAGVAFGNAIPRLIIFQFNPGSIDRTIEPQITKDPPIQFEGMAEETIKFKADFDATDYMADDSQETEAEMAAVVGIGPQLAGLELMASPDITAIIKGAVAAKVGAIEIKKMSIPLTLFIWGTKVLPVKIITIGVTEQVFNRALVPIRAEVSIELQVLSYGDFTDFKQPGPWIYGAHHAIKEVLSLSNSVYQINHMVDYYRK